MTDIQYIRFKREKKTYFIRCKDSDKVEDLKNMLVRFTGIEAENMRLYIGDRVQNCFNCEINFSSLKKSQLFMIKTCKMTA
jgi:hypothetical protein